MQNLGIYLGIRFVIPIPFVYGRDDTRLLSTYQGVIFLIYLGSVCLKFFRLIRGLYWLEVYEWLLRNQIEVLSLRILWRYRVSKQASCSRLISSRSDFLLQEIVDDENQQNDQEWWHHLFRTHKAFNRRGFQNSRGVIYRRYYIRRYHLVDKSYENVTV